MNGRILIAVCLVVGGALGRADAAQIWVPAGGDLQGAINSAVPGDEIVLEEGATYSGNFRLPVTSGSTYITIRSGSATAPHDPTYPRPGVRVSPADAAHMAKIQSTDYQFAIETALESHHWRLEGLEIRRALGQSTREIIALGYADETQDNLSVVPHDFVLDRIYIHGDPITGAKRGIGLNAAHVTISNSYCADFFAYYEGYGDPAATEAGVDTQCIAGWNGPGPFTITNNYLSAAGENILFGGADPRIADLIPSDITITNNLMEKPTAWRSMHVVVKNLLELKLAQRVQIDHNVFQYTWDDGQHHAIVLTPRGDAWWGRVADVVFEENTIRHVPACFNLLTMNDLNAFGYRNRLYNLTIRRNLCYTDMASWGGYGEFMQITGGTGDALTGLLVDHNTYVTANAFHTITLDAYVYGGAIINNVFDGPTTYGVFGSGLTSGTRSIQEFMGTTTWANNVLVPPAWQSGSDYPAGNFYPATHDSIGFIDYAGGNFTLASTSPYITAATDGTAIGYSAATPSSDPGPEVPSETVLLSDSFGGSGVPSSSWIVGTFTGNTQDAMIPVARASDLLQIGPLSSVDTWNGLYSANSYDFTNGEAQVKLVRAASGANDYTMFAAGLDANNFYRVVVSNGTLVFQKKIGGTKAVLYAAPYDAMQHQFLKISHSGGGVVFSTASQDGTWTARFQQAWNGGAIPLSSVRFELKAGAGAATSGTRMAQFDDFLATTP